MVYVIGLRGRAEPFRAAQECFKRELKGHEWVLTGSAGEILRCCKF